MLAIRAARRQELVMIRPENPAIAIRSPLWLAHRFDEGHRAFQFRRVNRAQHGLVPFLTDQHLGEEASPLVISAAETRAALAAGQQGPLHFLFHSAYCASTMLVRLLDQPGHAMGLSEPQLLNDMVGWRRRGADGREHAGIMETSLALLSRPFGAGEAVVVKPSNIVNPLAPGMMLLRPDARAVLLYAPLRDFLLSVARKGLWCRLWCRELLEGYLQEGFVNLGFEPRDYFRQSDLQVAAVGWLAQQAAFMQLLARFGERVATLDSQQLTRDPANTAAAVARHYGLSGRAADNFADHPAICRDSKSGADFAPGQRDKDLAAAEAAYGEEIAQVVGWAEAVALQAGIAMTLNQRLAV
jgi:hypothetical protein